MDQEQNSQTKRIKTNRAERLKAQLMKAKLKEKMLKQQIADIEKQEKKKISALNKKTKMWRTKIVYNTVTKALENGDIDREHFNTLLDKYVTRESQRKIMGLS